MIDHRQLNPARWNLKTVQEIGKRNGLPQVAVDREPMSSARSSVQRPKQEDFGQVFHKGSLD